MELQQRFGVQCSFLQALSLRSSIPYSWKRLLTQGYAGCTRLQYEVTINNSTFDILDSSPKKLYREKVRQVKPSFSCKDSWGRDLDDDRLLQEENWDDIFSLPFKITIETKLQSFGFKVINRLTPCAKYLHKIRVTESPLCDTCNEEDSILHFFFLCHCHKNSGEGYPNGVNYTLIYPFRT